MRSGRKFILPQRFSGFLYNVEMDNKRVLTRYISGDRLHSWLLFFSRGINRFRRDIDYRSRRDVSWNNERDPDKKKTRHTHTHTRFVTPYAACLCDLTPRAIRSRETRADRYRDKDLTRFPRFGRIIDPSPTPFPPLLLESSSLPAEVSSAKWINILSGSTQLVLAHDRSSCLQLSESFKLIS